MNNTVCSFILKTLYYIVCLIFREGNIPGDNIAGPKNGLKFNNRQMHSYLSIGLQSIPVMSRCCGGGRTMVHVNAGT